MTLSRRNFLLGTSAVVAVAAIPVVGDGVALESVSLSHFNFKAALATAYRETRDKMSAEMFDRSFTGAWPS